MGSALTLASVVSYLAGVTAGWRQGQLDDRLVIAMPTGLRAVPAYALASVLLIVSAVLVPVFPLSGARRCSRRTAPCAMAATSPG